MRAEFPHLLKPDAEVWKRFLAQYKDQFLRFDYDIRVGSGRSADRDAPDNIKKMALDISKRRIDAIGYTVNTIHIFEITRSAGLTALGQCLAYPLLYDRHYQPGMKLSSHIVCEQLQTDMRMPFVRLGITIHEI